ncbi:MAG: hypothetical protein J7K96_01370, partial [Desulfobacteraceae bacterium]|nr:hypothetical protein [Desulfobacteraceae bacterium]
MTANGSISISKLGSVLISVEAPPLENYSSLKSEIRPSNRKMSKNRGAKSHLVTRSEILIYWVFIIMKILLTNDDGIHAPGLFALYQALKS